MLSFNFSSVSSKCEIFLSNLEEVSFMTSSLTLVAKFFKDTFSISMFVSCSFIFFSVDKIFSSKHTFKVDILFSICWCSSSTSDSKFSNTTFESFEYDSRLLFKVSFSEFISSEN